MNIHAIREFRTRDPSNRVSELLFGPHGHRQRQHKCLAILKVYVCENDNQVTVRVREMPLFVTTHIG
jgi:hypothetical protein